MFLTKVKGNPLDASERVRQLPEGSLQIAGVAREDAGEYSCHVDNQFGTDTVTHTLSVLGKYIYIQIVRFKVEHECRQREDKTTK